MPIAPSPGSTAALPGELLILKLGGDALADPGRIADAARHAARLARHQPVVVVTSARRGVTDHLSALAAAVEQALATPAERRRHIECDRAIAAGEIVSAALVSAALNTLGCPARALDAREAGLRGRRGVEARLTRIRPGRLRRLLAAEVIPVVAGFQMTDAGRIHTLSRGGSDITAVALAAALGAPICHFLKRNGLCHTDPRRDPQAQPVGRTSYRGLHAILATGSPVLHPDAARLAERYGVVLRFEPFPEPGPLSDVTPTAA